MKAGDIVVVKVEDRRPMVGVVIGIDDKYPASITINNQPVFKVQSDSIDSYNQCWIKPVSEELKNEPLEVIKFYYEL